jgi:hypothetical protein
MIFALRCRGQARYLSQTPPCDLGQVTLLQLPRPLNET